MTLDKITKGILTKPIILEAHNEEEIKKILRIRLNEAGDVNVAVLLYHIEEVEEYYKLIQEMGFKCSKYYYELPKKEKWEIEKSLESVIVTTYKAAKGLEFQVVIMPNIETAMELYLLNSIELTPANDNNIPANFLKILSGPVDLLYPTNSNFGPDFEEVR